MKYALLFHNRPATEIPSASRESVLAAMVEEVRAWIAEADKAGVFRGSLRLAGVETATSLRDEAGNVVVTDGPFAETKEILSGFTLLECADLDEALAWAKRCPLVRIGTVEVRPEWSATPPA